MDTAWWKAGLLGIVEGLTEFLPVSSTGHLIVTRDLIGFADPHEIFSVVIQLGAILAVVAYFLPRFLSLTGALFRKQDQAWRFVIALVIASIPAGILGLLLDDVIDEHLMNSAVVAVSLGVGGFAILFIERRRAKVIHEDAWTLPWAIALGIGLCQLLALVPGISRSGATILGAICLGVARPAATEFSFFLAIPVMLGASSLKLVKHHDHLVGIGLPIAIGFVVSFIVAMATVHWLLRYVAKHDFRPFGWYRITAGCVLAGLALAGLIR